MSDDPRAISEVIYAFAHALDVRDWAMCRMCFMDEIEIDYSDFRGEPPRVVSADAYVASRKESLKYIKTLHLSSNHQVTITGDEAVCISKAVIYRYEEATQRTYDTYGFYTHRLKHTADGWKIAKVKQHVFWNTGDSSIHQKTPPA